MDERPFFSWELPETKDRRPAGHDNGSGAHERADRPRTPGPEPTAGDPDQVPTDAPATGTETDTSPSNPSRPPSRLTALLATLKDWRSPGLPLVIAVAVLVSAITGALVGGAAALLLFKPGEAAAPPRAAIDRAAGGASGRAAPSPVAEDTAVIDVVKKVSPAVVSIVVTRDIPETVPFSDPFLRHFFGTPNPDQGQREVGGGTGFIVTSDGLILTNKHVVSQVDAQYTVLLNDGKRYPAKVLARDPTNDIGLIQIKRSGLPTVELGSTDKVQIGQRVIAIGNALGEYRNTVSTGVVSGLSRSISAASGGADSEELRNVIQTDAAINPGNSGGPLLDIQGRVIGINTAIVQGAQNIGFAIPIDEARADLDSVRTHGKIIRPVIGIRFVPITPALKQEGDLPVDYGVLIPSPSSPEEPTVVPGGPAAKAGLRERDIILEIGGERVDQDKTLPRLMQKHKVGEKVALTVLRGGDRIKIEVQLGQASY